MAHQALIEDGDIRIEDLPGNFQPVAEAIGMAAALALARTCGGGEVYVPMIDSVSKAARDRTIRKQYKDGVSYQSLSRRYGLSISHIRSILAERSMPDGPDTVTKQLSLF
jgi:Mor family transcriptional regulator